MGLTRPCHSCCPCHKWTSDSQPSLALCQHVFGSSTQSTHFNRHPQTVTGMVKLVCRTCTFAKFYNLLVQGEQAHHMHTHLPALPPASVNLTRARINLLTTPRSPTRPPPLPWTHLPSPPPALTRTPPTTPPTTPQPPHLPPTTTLMTAERPPSLHPQLPPFPPTDCSTRCFLRCSSSGLHPTPRPLPHLTPRRLPSARIPPAPPDPHLAQHTLPTHPLPFCLHQPTIPSRMLHPTHGPCHPNTSRPTTRLPPSLAPTTIPRSPSHSRDTLRSTPASSNRPPFVTRFSTNS